MANDVVKTDEQVLAQIQELIEQGIRPTVYRLKKVNGNRGRDDRYKKLIEQYIQEHGSTFALKDPSPPTSNKERHALPDTVNQKLQELLSKQENAIIDLVSVMFTQSENSFKEPLNAAIEANSKLEARIAELVTEAQQNEDDAAALIQGLEDSLVEAESKVAEQQHTISEYQHKNDRLTGLQDTANASLAAQKEAFQRADQERQATQAKLNVTEKNLAVALHDGETKHQTIEGLQRSVDKRDHQIETLTEKVKELETKLQNQKQQLTTSNETVNRLGKQNSDLENANKALTKELKEREERYYTLADEMREFLLKTQSNGNDKATPPKQ